MVAQNPNPEPSRTSDPREAFARAEQLQHAGSLVEAEQIYQRLLQTHPDHPAVLHHLGLLQKAAGRLEDAERTLRRGIAAEPREAALYNALGGVCRRAGKVQEAMLAYQRAIELWPELPEAHYNLGVMFEESGRREEATAAYRRAVELQADFGKAQARLGVMLMQAGAEEEALGHFDVATQVAPEYFDGHYYRGWVLSSLKRHDEAVKSLTRARELRPDSFEALTATGNALREGGRNDEALAAYWNALEMRPGHGPLHEDLNKLAWMSGRSDLFLKSFGYARDRLGDEPDLMMMEGAFHLRREEWGSAATILQKAHQIAPSRGDIAGMYARALAGLQKYEESFPLFAAAIAAEPGQMRHRHEFGSALLKHGQPAEALSVFERANQANPYDQLVLSGLALTYRQLNDSRYHALVDYQKYVRVYELAPAGGLGDVESFNRALAEEIEGLHTMKAAPIDQTLRGGTQTTGTLFDETGPAVRALRHSIDQAVADYIREVSKPAADAANQAREARFRYAGSWSCRLKSGGYHNNHVHPQGWISSAYYVRLPDFADDPRRPGWLKFGESNLGLGGRDVPESFVKPRVGRLVLFPSYYWHGTVPFAEEGERLGIAFDAVPATHASAPPAPEKT